jgi:hypothetical protein
MSTQAEVDSWDCEFHTYQGVVLISGPDITNLDSMIELWITWSKVVIKDNPLLTSIDGLSNLTTAASITIQNNPLLEDLNGLAMCNAGRLVIDNNASLIDLNGTESFSPGVIKISNNISLTSFDGLTSIDEVYDTLLISNNLRLKNLDPLASLTVLNHVIITDNDSLTGFCGLYEPFILDPPTSLAISGNRVNPTYYDVLGIGTCGIFKVAIAGYSSLTEALDTAADYGFIHVTRNHTIDTSITFPGADHFTLVIDPEVTLTIDGSIFTNDGLIINHGTFAFINSAQLINTSTVVNSGFIIGIE